MVAKMVILSPNKDKVLLFVNPKLNRLTILDENVFNTEPPFTTVKRFMKMNFGVAEDKYSTVFVRKEEVLKAGRIAENNYVVAVLLKEDIEFPITYEWVPISDDRVLTDTDDCGVIYTYLQEALRLTTN